MAAFYQFDGENKPFGRIQRTGLDSFRDGVAKLNRIKGIYQQASDTQLVALFGYSDVGIAAAAKAEFLADCPVLTAAQQQMLDQFG